MIRQLPGHVRGSYSLVVLGSRACADWPVVSGPADRQQGQADATLSRVEGRSRAYT
jgi:hypothetical protein